MRSLLLLVVLAGPLLPASDTGPVQPLRSQPKATPSYLRDTNVVRFRAVRLRLRDFSKPAPFVTRLALFPDTVLTIRWDYSGKLRNGDTELTGHVDRTVAGTAALIFSTTSLTGNISDGQKWRYELRTDPAGHVWILQRRQSVNPE